MSRWFRFYDETLNDPKSLKLSDKTFRIWIGVLCAASKNEGKIPLFDDLAILLRIKPAKLQPELEKLIAAELIDHDDNGMRPHNWDKRQYKSDVSTDRVKRFRNGGKAVAETPPETETETETEVEPSHLPSPIDSKILSIGEPKREVTPPKHCAQNREKNRVYIEKGTPEWDAYSADYRATTGKEPNVNPHGGKWFKTQGQATSDGLDIPSYLRRA